MATVPCTGAVPSRPPARQPAPPCLDAGSIRCVAAGDTARCGEWHVRWRALLRGRRRLGRGRGWSRAWVGRGQSQKWSAARAAQRTGASSRCGAQYGEFALRPARALSLASRLRWLLKSFLSVRFSCFSSKRPNSAAMTDLGGASATRGFPLCRLFFWSGWSRNLVRETVSDPKRMQNLMFFHTQHRHRHCAPLSSRAGRETRALTESGGGGPPRSYSAALR